MVEEIVVTDSQDKSTFKTMNFFTDQFINIRLDKVAWVEFIDFNSNDFCRNLCRDGLKQIPRVIPLQKPKIESSIDEIAQSTVQKANENKLQTAL